MQSDFQAKRVSPYEERFLRQGDGERGNASRLVDGRAQEGAEVHHGLHFPAVRFREEEKGTERPFDVRGVAQERFTFPALCAQFEEPSDVREGIEDLVGEKREERPQSRKRRR